MKEFKGKLKSRTGKVRIAFAILTCYMMYLEARREHWIFVALGVFVVVACFFSKEHIISEKGVDIKYNLFSLETHNYWEWKEITTLHADYKKAAPHVMLHIGKDIVSRTFTYDASEIDEIFALAKKQNYKIFIDKM